MKRFLFLVLKLPALYGHLWTRVNQISIIINSIEMKGGEKVDG